MNKDYIRFVTVKTVFGEKSLVVSKEEYDDYREKVNQCFERLEKRISALEGANDSSKKEELEDKYQKEAEEVKNEDWDAVAALNNTDLYGLLNILLEESGEKDYFIDMLNNIKSAFGIQGKEK